MDKTYEQGLTDGKIDALESILSQHRTRLDDHSSRLRLLERSLWVMLGILTAVQFLPEIFAFIKN